MLSVALVVAGAGCNPFTPVFPFPPALPGIDPGAVGDAISPVAPAAPDPSSEGVDRRNPASASAALSDATLATLACIRRWESGGDYAIDTGNGFYGAHQAD